jgi:2-keto-4-pentenoate hydratase
LRLNKILFLLTRFFILTGIMILLFINCSNRKEEITGNSLKYRQLVRDIVSARLAKTTLPLPTTILGDIQTNEAYQIQHAIANELSKSLGAIVGYKVAYASKAAQQQFGVSEPACGPFFKDQRVPSGSVLPATGFIELLMETEIAFTVGKKIDSKIKNIQELKTHIKWVHAAFDLGENRFLISDGNPTVSDQIATGTGAQVFVIGPAVDPGKVDIDGTVLKLIQNKEIIRESPATEVMGSPWNSMLWLANHVVEFGGVLEAGDVVLTGTAAPAFRGKGNSAKGFFEGDCGDLGKVSLTIE